MLTPHKDDPNRKEQLEHRKKALDPKDPTPNTWGPHGSQNRRDDAKKEK